MRVNETYGLDRMALVANHSSAVLEFFGLIGHLFMNGTLGYVDGDHIYLGANGSYELRQGVLSVFSDIWDIDKDLDSAFGSVFFQERRIFTDRELDFASDATKRLNVRTSLT